MHFHKLKFLKATNRARRGDRACWKWILCTFPVCEVAFFCSELGLRHCSTSSACSPFMVGKWLRRTLNNRQLGELSCLYMHKLPCLSQPNNLCSNHLPPKRKETNELSQPAPCIRLKQARALQHPTGVPRNQARSRGFCFSATFKGGVAYIRHLESPVWLGQFHLSTPQKLYGCSPKPVRDPCGFPMVSL